MQHNTLDRDALDQTYLEEWEKFWSQLDSDQKQEYKSLGIEGPELTTYTTKREEFDADRVVSTVGLQISKKPAVLLPELESIWISENVPLAIVQTLGNLGSPFYSDHSTGSFSIPEKMAKPLRIVLEAIQSEPTPGLALAIVLKWLDSGEVKYSDRELAKIFGVTFQTVSITRERLAEKYGCPIFAGKSEAAKESYRLSNKKKVASSR